MGCLRDNFFSVFGLGFSSETTACEKPLFGCFFVFEHFFYSSATDNDRYLADNCQYGNACAFYHVFGSSREPLLPSFEEHPAKQKRIDKTSCM